VGQFEILRLLEKEDRKMTSKEIRKELRTCNITRRLEKLRQFGLVNFEILPVFQKRGIRPVYFYWNKEG
jgi:hypothetical protein